MIDYVENYIRAVNNPPQELAETFAEEQEFLQQQACGDDHVLALGVETLQSAATLTDCVSEVSCVIWADKGVQYAREEFSDVDGLTIRQEDPSNLPFDAAAFDLSFSTYNTLGSLPEDKKLPVLQEMTRTTRPEGRIINITWRRNNQTTQFLQNYYPAIGIDVERVTEQHAITEKGVFHRLGEEELSSLYKAAGLKNITLESVGLLWHAAVAIRPNQ